MIKSSCVECDKQNGKKYRQTPNGKKKEHIKVSRRRARKKNAEGDYTSDDIKRLFYDQFGKCAGCNRNFCEKLKYTIDHKTPLSKGGSNWPHNLQLLCGSCNSRKYNKTMDEWLKYKAFN